MGRPKSANPKSEHIGIVTTPNLKERFKALGLVGDEAIVVLLHYLEKENKKLEIEKILKINQIKNIDKQIEELEFEKLKLETQIENINQEMGLAASGHSVDVERAVGTILQRFNNQSVYNIVEFLSQNQELVKGQAYLCGLEVSQLEDIVFERS